MIPDSEVPQLAPAMRRSRRRWARGASRPEYLNPGDVDKLMMMFVALMSEVSSLRDRIDTHEAIAQLGKPATTSDVESYQLSAERRAAREELRQSMLKRVLRVMHEDLEAARDGVK
jgi:hypothetical protein